jgi:hypothetical protein
MTTLRTLLALAFLTAPAFAQTANPPTANERAIGAKLMAEINAGLTCSAGLIGAQDEVAALQKQVKDLEAKLSEAGKK